MARVVLRHIVFGFAATGLLMGCVEGGGKTGPDGAQVSAPAKKGKGAQDVEAPEIYQTTDSALWDGRPSLGGIWVAGPDVTNPERALIFNPATGKSVTGALFKRERENPGPPLQLSSDAAEALGILAGQPTEIRVTALRKEDVAEPASTEKPALADAAPEEDPAAQPAGDAAAIASAALDAVDAKPVDPAAASADAASEPDGSGAALTAAAAGTAAALAPDGTPKKKTWKERRAEAKAAREAKKRAAAEAKAAAAAAAAGAAPLEGEAPVASPDAAAAALAPIESAPLDARSPEATTPAETPKSKRKTVGDTAAAPATPEVSTAPAAAPSGAVRPIQVASFSKEDNAKRAAEALAKIGVTATPQKSDQKGKAVWGVVVMGDDAMLKKIKDAGFADAYYLK
jgi:rare lipoprotein A